MRHSRKERIFFTPNEALQLDSFTDRLYIW